MLLCKKQKDALGITGKEETNRIKQSLRSTYSIKRMWKEWVTEIEVIDVGNDWCCFLLVYNYYLQIMEKELATWDIGNHVHIRITLRSSPVGLYILENM